jgi:hypothetical protein
MLLILVDYNYNTTHKYVSTTKLSSPLSNSLNYTNTSVVGRGVKLTIHPFHVSRLRRSGFIAPLPPPPGGFTACTGTI